MFLYGAVLAAWKVWQISRQTIELRDRRPEGGSPVARYLATVAGGDDRTAERAAQVLRLTLTNRIVGVRHIANSLVLLGLIGTVIGFIISLSGVDPAAASDANKVGAMVATLIGGMSVALNTTLVGAILYVWLIVNHRILVSGTVGLLTTAMQAVPDSAEGAAGQRAAAE